MKRLFIFAFIFAISANPTSSQETVTLVIGGTAIITTIDGESLNMRDQPTLVNSTIIHQLPSGTLVSILDGPVQVDGLLWWQLRSPSGVEGWAVERVGEVQTLIPLNIRPSTDDCFFASRPTIGIEPATILSITPLWTEPSRSSIILTTIDVNEMVQVIGGPICAENIYWFIVHYSDLVGWLNEFIDDQHILGFTEDYFPSEYDETHIYTNLIGWWQLGYNMDITEPAMSPEEAHLIILSDGRYFERTTEDSLIKGTYYYIDGRVYTQVNGQNSSFEVYVEGFNLYVDNQISYTRIFPPEDVQVFSILYPEAQYLEEEGIHVSIYCQAKGYDYAEFVEGDAYSWLCISIDGSEPLEIAFSVACREAYGDERPYATLAGATEHYGWKCSPTEGYIAPPLVAETSSKSVGVEIALGVANVIEVAPDLWEQYELGEYIVEYLSGNVDALDTFCTAILELNIILPDQPAIEDVNFSCTWGNAGVFLIMNGNPIGLIPILIEPDEYIDPLLDPINDFAWSFPITCTIFPDFYICN